MQTKKAILNRLDNLPITSAHWVLVILIGFGSLFAAIEQYNANYAGAALQNLWGISTSDLGLITSLTFGGMMIGALIAGITGDLVGRKFTYIYNLILYSLGSLICAFAPDFAILLLGRFVVGIGLGGELNTGLTIISECTPAAKRGRFVAMVNVAAGGLGIFAASAIAYVMLGPLGNLFGGETTSWRWLLGIMVLPAGLVFWYRRYMPETPRFLLTRGRYAEADDVVNMFSEGKLRKLKVASAQSQNVLKDDTFEEERKGSLLDTLKGMYLRRTILSFLLMVSAFGASITAVVLMPALLLSKGFDIVNSLLFVMIINLGGLAGAIIASWLGSKVGRKKAISISAILTIFAAIWVGNATSVSTVIIAGFILQAFCIFINTNAWLYAPELYPTRIRAFGTGLAMIFSLGAGVFVPPLGSKLLESNGSFGLLGMIAILYAVLAVSMLVLGEETLGRSLEEVSENESSPTSFKESGEFL